MLTKICDDNVILRLGSRSHQYPVCPSRKTIISIAHGISGLCKLAQAAQLISYRITTPLIAK